MFLKFKFKLFYFLKMFELMSSVVTFPQNRYGEKRILVEFAGNLENHCLDF